MGHNDRRRRIRAGITFSKVYKFNSNVKNTENRIWEKLVSRQLTVSQKLEIIQKRAKKNLLEVKQLCSKHKIAAGAFLISCFSLFFTFFGGFPSMVQYFYPSVSIEAEPSSGIKNPFDQNFIIRNTGSLPIYNVTFHFEIMHVNDEKMPNQIGIVLKPIKKLSQNEAQSFRIYYFKADQNLVRSCEVDECFIYKPFLWLWPISSTCRFKLNQNSDGSFNWLAEGIPEDEFIPVTMGALPNGESAMVFPSDGRTPFTTNTPP